MDELRENLMNRLDRTIEHLRRSKASQYAGSTSNRRMVNALVDLKYQLLQTGKIDILKARQLFSMTGTLQELALENDWGSQYVGLSREINLFLDKLTEPEKIT